MQKKELEHKSFDLAQTENKVLSIRVSPNGLYFIVTDANKSNLALFTSRIIDTERGGLEVLADEIKNNTLFTHQFLKTNIFYETTQYTLVPTFELEKNSAKEIASVCFGEEKLKGMVVRAENMSFYNSSVVYAIPESDLKRMQTYLPEANIYHHIHAPLYGSLTTAKTKEKYALLNITAFFFDMIIVEGGEVKFCCSFQYKNTEEFLYFVLGVVSSKHIDPYALKVLLSGEVDSYSSIVQSLNKYLMAYYPDSAKGITLKRPFTKIEKFQHYFTLFLMPVCV